MRALLDTHAFLWWIDDDPMLPPRVREIIGDGENEILLSVVSVWEIAIKKSLGRLDMPADFARFMSEQISLNGFRVLPVELAHALRIESLSHHHRDPFDRLLIAQGLVEDVAILSRDDDFSAYGVERVW